MMSKQSKNKSVVQRNTRYQIDYVLSYGELSPFFAGLKEKRLMGTRCKPCRKTFATPRVMCDLCGGECKWVELPQTGKVHSWTTCHYGSDAFLKQTPYHLILVELPGVDTLFLSQLKNAKEGKIQIGMAVLARFVKKSGLKASDVYFVPRKEPL